MGRLQHWTLLNVNLSSAERDMIEKKAEDRKTAVSQLIREQLLGVRLCPMCKGTGDVVAPSVKPVESVDEAEKEA